MCFSPEASFIASFALIGIGTLSYKFSKNTGQKLLASIPMIFALQQFSEGIIWLQLMGVIDNPSLFSLSKSIFLYIAYALWPIWISFILLVNEKQNFKKKLMFVFLIMGILDAFFNLKGLPLNEIQPQIVEHSIQYDVDVFLFYKFMYILFLLIPLFLSSFPLMWLFGFVIGLTSFVSLYFYSLTFTSIWCFAATLSSLCILFAIRACGKSVHN